MDIDYLIDKSMLEEIYNKVIKSNNYTIRKIEFIPLPIVDSERRVRESLEDIVYKRNLKYGKKDIDNIVDIIIDSVISVITLYYNFTTTQPYSPNIKDIAMTIIVDQLNEWRMVDIVDAIDMALINDTIMYLANTLTNALKNIDHINVSDVMGLYSITPYLDSVGVDDTSIVFSTHNIVKLLYAKR